MRTFNFRVAIRRLRCMRAGCTLVYILNCRHAMHFNIRELNTFCASNVCIHVTRKRKKEIASSILSKYASRIEFSTLGLFEIRVFPQAAEMRSAFWLCRSYSRLNLCAACQSSSWIRRTKLIKFAVERMGFVWQIRKFSVKKFYVCVFCSTFLCGTGFIFGGQRHYIAAGSGRSELYIGCWKMHAPVLLCT